LGLELSTTVLLKCSIPEDQNSFIEIQHFKHEFRLINLTNTISNVQKTHAVHEEDHSWLICR